MSTGLDFRRLAALELAYESSPKDGGNSVKSEIFLKAIHKFKPAIADEIWSEAVTTLKGEDGSIPHDNILKLLQAAKFARVVTSSNKREEYSGPSHMQTLIGYSPRDIANPSRKHLEQVYQRLMQKHHNLIQAFISVDGNYVSATQDGKVSIHEFSEAMAGLNLLFTDYELEGMFKTLDSQGKGYFNYEDFAKIKGDARLNAANAGPAKADVVEGSRSASLCSTRSRMYFGPKRVQAVLPSDANPSFSYGVATLPTDNMQDVLQHNFAKEYLSKLTLHAPSKAGSISPTVRGKRGTLASVKRAAAIREKYKLDQEDIKPQWKIKRFNSILPKLTGNRMDNGRSLEGKEARTLLNRSAKV
jgi:hypothetical protein